MTVNDEHTCVSCGEALPEHARSDSKYCSRLCKNRAAKRRAREKKDAAKISEFERLQQIEDEFYRLKAAHAKQTELLTQRNLQIRRLKHSLRRADHQLETFAGEQAQRTRAVRDELAMAESEVATLRRNWSQREAAVTASQEVTELRERLATVTERYNDLVAKYRELSGAAQYAATERKHLQGIVRQWDAMCVRLYKATGGRPKRDADKEVLATWTQFRKLVRR